MMTHSTVTTVGPNSRADAALAILSRSTWSIINLSKVELRPSIDRNKYLPDMQDTVM